MDSILAPKWPGWQPSGMAELKFSGKIVNGIGRHVELYVPGRSALPNAPEDWPDELRPGSLNLRVSEFPDEFRARGLEPSTKSLDVAEFAPVFVVPQDTLGNNKLMPTKEMPNRGTAQIWRTALEVESEKLPCWVLRRFGSGLRDQLEVVSNLHLRAKLGLTKGHEWPATVTMFGDWPL